MAGIRDPLFQQYESCCAPWKLPIPQRKAKEAAESNENEWISVCFVWLVPVEEEELPALHRVQPEATRI
jgi:hypothetical protein